MKINPAASDLTYTQRVDEKEDTSDKDFSQHMRDQEQKKKKKDPAEIVVTDEKVKIAIEGFKKEIHAEQNGLIAIPEGQGPGLRVYLKDGSGAVIRQWTGEEFLKLREAANTKTEEPNRGKILDQKL